MDNNKMPIYPPKKQTQSETRLELVTKYNKYLLTIRSSQTSTILYIGGAHFWCLECQIFPDKKIAYLPKIEFNDGCSLSGNFERGKDIKIIMRLLLSYLHINYPMINAIHFNDFSFRHCTESQTVDLAPFYYVLYGKTWYMKHMDATFVEDGDALRFAETSERFQEMKLKMKWEDFDAYITTKHPLSVTEMKSIFETNKTWSSYFLTILEKTDIETLCLYMGHWITNFVAKVGKIRFHSYDFSMPVPNPLLGNVEYTTMKYTVRGGAYTRRQPKKKAMDLR